jgi:hypothetical protein
VTTINWIPERRYRVPPTPVSRCGWSSRLVVTHRRSSNGNTIPRDLLECGLKVADDSTPRPDPVVATPFAGRKPAIAGDPDRVVDQIRRHVDLGWTMLLVDFFGRDIREPARLFADRVSHTCATDHDPVANPRPRCYVFARNTGTKGER